MIPWLCALATWIADRRQRATDRVSQSTSSQRLHAADALEAKGHIRRVELIVAKCLSVAALIGLVVFMWASS